MDIISFAAGVIATLCAICVGIVTAAIVAVFNQNKNQKGDK
jgi:hypothetical protein